MATYLHFVNPEIGKFRVDKIVFVILPNVVLVSLHIKVGSESFEESNKRNRISIGPFV